jgi:hypothetical protein
MRHEVYRVAYDEAHAELNEILGKFEQLRIRKDKVEKLVEALKPLLSSGDLQTRPLERTPAIAERQSAGTEQPAVPAQPEPVVVAVNSIPYPVQQAVDAGDPFSRRHDSVARDVKEYSRLFNSTLTR